VFPLVIHPLLLPNTPEFIQGIYTMLRDKDCSRQNFIFFTDRLSTLLVEYALQHLPYAQKAVVTPVGVELNGKKLAAQVRVFSEYIAHVLCHSID
jgi:uridine kinase